MLYLVDGYNFVFRLGLNKKISLQAQREEFIRTFSDCVEKLNLQVVIVFDGQDLPVGSYTRGNWRNIEIVYTHHGLSADDYIVDRLELSKKPKTLTIVTSDRKLAEKAHRHGTEVMSVENFMHFLVRKERKKHPQIEKPAFREAGFQLDRLLRIFEDRLKDL